MTQTGMEGATNPGFPSAPPSDQQAPNGAPPGSQPIPGYPGYFQTPWGEVGYVTQTTTQDMYGNQVPAGKWVTVPRSLVSPGGGGYNMGQDPRYWQLQYDQLARDYANIGMDAESARRQAFATLIANRNNTQLGIANTSANIAKTEADYAANPRDAVSELIYRNQAQGTTPFGDINNSAFGEYGKALAAKAASIFSPVNADLQTARNSAGQWPPGEFVNPVQIPPGFMKGTGDHPINVNGPTRFGGYQPSSSEGGTNMNIHEPFLIVGAHSKHVYATGGEGGFPEQVKIVPTPSGKKAAMAMEKSGKMMDGMMQGAKPMATGGTVSSTPDDFMNELNKQLRRLGGPGGGVGPYSTPLPSLRLLAGAPANALANDPVLNDYTMAGYSALGIDPRTVQATIKQFTPNAPSWQRQIVF